MTEDFGRPAYRVCGSGKEAPVGRLNGSVVLCVGIVIVRWQPDTRASLTEDDTLSVEQ